MFFEIVVVLFAILVFLIIWVLIANWFNGPLTDLTHSMKGKVVVITGASRGIGLETTKDLLRQGATVIMGSRDENQAHKALESIQNNTHKSHCVFMHLDLTDYDNINKFVEEVKNKYGKIDILINNAGSCFQNFTLSDGIELTYFTNHLGHLILSCLFLDNFNPKGRIINVVTTKYKRIWTRTLDKFTSNSNLDFSYNRKGYDWMKTYILSKLAGVHLAQYLGDYCTNKKIDIKVVSLHPGFINNYFFREIEKHSIYWFIRDFLMIPLRWLTFKDNVMGAQTTLHCCYMEWEKLSNGGYYNNCRYEQLWSIGLLNNAQKLIAFDKAIIEKNNIVKGDKRVMQIFK
jgi:NAD(P)-dependent dehydrogenase (short-subunit alcohol dehydrogenase family)